MTTVLSIGITIVACGGSAPAASPPPTPTATAAPTSEASASSAPSSAAVPTPTVSEPPLAPSFELSELTEGLENVKSYRIEIEQAGHVVYEATVIHEPVEAVEMLFEYGPDSVARVIQIKADTWIAEGSGSFRKGDDPFILLQAEAMSPRLFFGPLVNGNIAAASTALGEEEKNGATATHYRFDPSSPLAAGFDVPAGATVDYWVGGDGYLVAYEFVGASQAENVSINITGVDDPANKVEPPG